MRVEFVCATCAIGGVHETKRIDLRDDSIYRFECSHGHQVSVELACLRFEMLFEIGIAAIKDSYYREAVSSFTASLERFYEFCIRVYSAKISTKVQSGLTVGVFKNAWKSVSNMSERQYGAYVLLHATVVGESPLVQSDAERKFRNKVIHQGSYTTKREAIDYGESVLVILRTGIGILREKLSLETQATALLMRLENRDSAAPEEFLGSHFFPTLVNLTDDPDGDRWAQKLADILE